MLMLILSVKLKYVSQCHYSSLDELEMDLDLQQLIVDHTKCFLSAIFDFIWKEQSKLSSMVHRSPILFLHQTTKFLQLYDDNDGNDDEVVDEGGDYDNDEEDDDVIIPPGYKFKIVPSFKITRPLPSITTNTSSTSVSVEIPTG